MRWLVGYFLIAHGILHLLIWLPAKGEEAPFDAHDSPIRGDVRVAATILAVAAGGASVVGGTGVLAQQPWAPGLVLIAAAVSAVLLLLTFTPWWLAALAIDLVIGILAVRSLGRG